MKAKGDLRIDIVRTGRKSVGLCFKGPDRLEVRAPRGMSPAVLEALLEKREGWILEKRSLLLEAAREEPAREGSLFLFGEPLVLEMKPGKTESAVLSNHVLKLAWTEAGRIPRQVEAFYRERARAYFGSRLTDLSRTMGMDRGAFSVRNQKSRWGSCSPSGALSLNCRLMMAPREVIEYVLIHELCHRRHMDHSEGFWREVARWDPAWRGHRDWLRRKGWRLSFESVGCLAEALASENGERGNRGKQALHML